MIIEMLNPIEANLVVGPFINGGFKTPRVRKTAFYIPIGQMVNAFNDNIRGNIVTVATNATNYNCPFSIAKLYFFPFSAFFGPSYDHSSANLAHYQTGFVEIIYVAVLDAIFGPYIGHQLKPRV